MVKFMDEDMSPKRYMDADLLDAEQLQGIRLTSGDIMAGRFPAGIRVRIAAKKRPHDFFYAGPMPVISDRLKRIFDSFRANIEYHPLAITLHPTISSESSYYYANIIDVVDCLDWQVSEYNSDRGYACDLMRVAIVDGLVNDCPVFLVARTIPRLIAVQERVATAIQESGCRGVVLQSPSAWTNPAYPNQ